MINPIFDQIVNHIQAYNQKVAQGSSMYGLGALTSRFFSRDTFEEDTVNLVQDIVKKVDHPEELDEGTATKIRELFFDIIPKACSTETKESIRDLLSDSRPLQNLLDPEVAEGRRKKEAGETSRKDLDSRLSRRIAKVKLAYKLGYEGKLVGKGQGGAKYLSDVGRKPLGVFKTTLEHQSIWKNLHDGPLSYVMHNQAFYVSTEGAAPAQAEEAAYIVSTKMGFGALVPPTQVMDLEGIQGSFQLLAKKGEGREIKEYSSIATQFKNREEYSKEEIQMFQIFAVFDYLINNLDRHSRNWLVEYTKEGEDVRLHKIHAIDHDRAFIHTVPDSNRGLRNHYKWRHLKIAKEPLTPETREFILTNLSDEALIEALDFQSERMAGFMTDDKQQRMREKMHALRKAAEYEGTSMEDVGEIRSPDKIMKFTVGPRVSDSESET